MWRTKWFHQNNSTTKTELYCLFVSLLPMMSERWGCDVMRIKLHSCRFLDAWFHQNNATTKTELYCLIVSLLPMMSESDAVMSSDHTKISIESYYISILFRFFLFKAMFWEVKLFFNLVSSWKIKNKKNSNRIYN